MPRVARAQAPTRSDSAWFRIYGGKRLMFLGAEADFRDQGINVTMDGSAARSSLSHTASTPIRSACRLSARWWNHIAQPWNRSWSSYVFDRFPACSASSAGRSRLREWSGLASAPAARGRRLKIFPHCSLNSIDLKSINRARHKLRDTMLIKGGRRGRRFDHHHLQLDRGQKLKTSRSCNFADFDLTSGAIR
jgi:hypothetical protein